MSASTIPLLITASILLGGPLARAQTARTPEPSPSQELLVERIENGRNENGTVYFHYAGGAAKPPAPIRTGIVDLLSIGSIKSGAANIPYFLFSGLPCSDCRDSPNIYILRPDGRRPSSFIYPGKIIDPENGAVLLQSRAFYGKCLRNLPGESYVVFQQERVDRRKSLQSSVFIAEPGPDHLLERLLERRLPRIEETLKLVRQKLCHEISGKNRTMLRKLLDLKPKRDPEKTEEVNDPESPDSPESDAPPKENQTDKDLSVPQQEI